MTSTPSQPSKPSSSNLKQYYVACGTSEAKLTTLVELLQALQQDSSRLALAVCCGSRVSLDEVVATLAACGGFTLAVLHSDLSVAEMELQVSELKVALQQLGGQPASDGELGAGGSDAASGGGAAGGGEPAAGMPPTAGAAAPGAMPSGQPQQQPRQAAGASGSAGQQQPAQPPADDASTLVLAATDAALRALGREALPLGLPLMVSYDLPPSKEVHTRRLASVFGASRERRRGTRPAVVVDFVVAHEVAAFRAREAFSSAAVSALPVHVPDIFAV